ncbi:MAG: right-handed parallel beta-helix repeat-containing protein [Candidatus Thermoplasmatota archaeon]|nr:right-handed parallel beta-helix repeat-containing protein [Candidatus Thermoplasmatota archaeon]
MNKIITLAIAFLLLFIPFASINGGNVASNINTSGNILYVGGSGPNNYTSIQSAINDADNSYTIYVYYGIYNESIVINKSISLIGIEKNGEKPIIDGGGRNFAVNITADRCTVKQLEIANYGDFSSWPLEKRGHGIKMYSSNNIIENNAIECNFTPFYLSYSSNNIISGNRFSGGKWTGLHLGDANSNLITKNNISNNPGAGAVFLARSCDNTISKNEIRKNLHGITLGEDVDNNTISYNNVCHNRQYGITISDGSYNEIVGNNVCYNRYDGILITDASYNTILNNNISSSGWSGIQLKGGSSSPLITYNNTISGNQICYNNEGVYLLGSGANNFITKNDFIKNACNAKFSFYRHSYEGYFYHNIWYNNYWSDWKLPLPRPIFGKIWDPFLHRWVNFDWHPSLTPYR